MQDEKLKKLIKQMLVEAYNESINSEPKYEFVFKKHSKRKNGIGYTIVGIYTYNISNTPRLVASRAVNTNVSVEDAIDDMISDNQDYIDDDNKDNFVDCLRQLVSNLFDYRNNRDTSHYDAYLNNMISEL